MSLKKSITFIKKLYSHLWFHLSGRARAEKEYLKLIMERKEKELLSSVKSKGVNLSKAEVVHVPVIPSTSFPEPNDNDFKDWHKHQ